MAHAKWLMKQRWGPSQVREKEAEEGRAGEGERERERERARTKVEIGKSFTGITDAQ